MTENDRLDDYVNGVEPKGAKKEGRYEIWWIISWFASVVLFILCTFVIPCSWWWTIIFGALAVLLFVPTIYFGFVPLNICFTFVKEGTAKAVIAGGAVVDIIFQYNDHEKDAYGNIRTEPGVIQPSFLGLGGLRFYGVWPFRQIHEYEFSWASVDQNGEKKEHTGEKLDYIMLMDTLYWFNVKEAEDSRLLPLNLEGLLTIRVTNPYKAMFAAQNWLKIVLALVQTLLRGEVAEADYETLAARKKLLGVKIKSDPDAVPLWKELENLYGIQVLKIEVKDIDPPEKFRELTMKEFIAEQERKVVNVAAQAEAERTKKVYSAIEAQGDTGRLIRTLEMLEKSQDKWIVSPDILNAVKNLFSAGKGS